MKSSNEYTFSVQFYIFMRPSTHTKHPWVWEWGEKKSIRPNTEDGREKSSFSLRFIPFEDIRKKKNLVYISNNRSIRDDDVSSERNFNNVVTYCTIKSQLTVKALSIGIFHQLK